MASGVEALGITKSFAGVRVLEGVSARFEPGRLTSLLGPSGSGKTTLLRIVAGFIAPDEGSIRIGGDDVTKVPVWRRRIGVVFQSYALFPHMTVAENVVFGLHRRGTRGAAARAEVARVLDMVRLTGFETRRPKQLSGGQQQRVALARAIVTRPSVLLLDEPLSALDRRLRQEMQVELRRIQRESGLTTLFVTHDQEEALTLSDRVAILDRGRIIQEGEPADIYERPRSRFAAAFLGDANFIDGRVASGGVQSGGHLIRTYDELPPPGTMVTLAIRPEKLRMMPVGAVAAAGENTVEAVLVRTVFAGAALTHALEADGIGPMRVFAQNRDTVVPAEGERVTLSWSPVSSVVLSE